MTIVWIFTYGSTLERSVYSIHPEDYLFMYIFGALGLAAISLVMGPLLGLANMAMTGKGMVMMLIYVWSKEFPHQVRPFIDAVMMLLNICFKEFLTTAHSRLAHPLHSTTRCPRGSNKRSKADWLCFSSRSKRIASFGHPCNGDVCGNLQADARPACNASRCSRLQDIAFYGVVKFKGFWLPFILLGISVLIHEKQIFVQLAGIAVGHLWYFLTILLPRGTGETYLPTPAWMLTLAQKLGMEGASTAVMVGAAAPPGGPVSPRGAERFRTFRGAGQRLGSR
jgi:hypothetical protein